MMRMLLASLLVIGLLITGSDSVYFPWLNYAGLAVMGGAAFLMMRLSTAPGPWR